jgi:uncharacterized protein
MTVEHVPKESRFVVRIGADTAELTYTLPDVHTIDLQHTSVPESARGHGVADALAEAAFAYARAQGLQVIPTCPFVRRWLIKHPEQHDLVRLPPGGADVGQLHR